MTRRAAARCLPGICLALSMLAPTSLRADQVKLVDGGTLEGKVRREGGHVIVQLDSGEIRLAADDVASVRAERSALHECDERRQALQRHDVPGRVELARFCQAQGLPNQARLLWQEVVRLDPDNAQARHALGYVRDGERWLTEDELAQRQGKVRYQGQWIDASAMAQIEQARAAAAIAEQAQKQAEQERAKAEVELQAARDRAAADQAAREADEKRAEADADLADDYAYLGYGGWYGYGYPGWWAQPRPCHNRPGSVCPPGNGRPSRSSGSLRPNYGPFPIAGVKDPRSY